MQTSRFPELANVGTLADRPAVLFRLLVACILAGAPVRADRAAAAARAVFAAGWTTPEKLARATLRRRIAVLTEAGYPRFVGRAASSLGSASRALAEEYGGDLRKLRAEAGGEREMVERLLRRFPGIGEVAAGIFCAEVAAVWPEAAKQVRTRATTHRR
ncbi:MAG TPA: hypothetical protein VM600_03590 [Actinomycetota bacterium]|nr:hypothetical protein [Actinomycetota bacterium]